MLAESPLVETGPSKNASEPETRPLKNGSGDQDQPPGRQHRSCQDRENIGTRRRATKENEKWERKRFSDDLIFCDGFCLHSRLH